MRRTIKQQRLQHSRRAGYLAWRAAEEARARALPPAPADPLPGALLQEWSFRGVGGWLHAVQLRQPPDRGVKRPRSDQFVLVIDGVVVFDMIGLTDIMDHLRTKVLPAQMTRKQRRQADTFSHAWTGRDELDAAAA